MTRTRIATFAIGGITLLFTGAALAYGPPAGQGQGGGPGGPGPGFGMFRGIVNALDLNDEQQAMVDGWREEMQAEREAHFEAAQAARQTFRDEFASGHPKAKVLHDLVDQRIEAQAEMMHTGIDHLLTLYATLSDEQLATLNELIEQGPPGRGPQGRPGRGQGRGNRGGPPDRDW